MLQYSKTLMSLMSPYMNPRTHLHNFDWLLLEYLKFANALVGVLGQKIKHYNQTMNFVLQWEIERLLFIIGYKQIEPKAKQIFSSPIMNKSRCNIGPKHLLKG